MIESSKKIVVIDDEIPLLNNIAAILELYGFDCIKISNASDAFTIIQNEQPRIVICDMMMEPVDGFAVLQQLKSHQSTKNIPFIFLSARADITDKQRGIEAGANAYLTKPFTAKDLVQMVKNFISTSDL